MHFRTRAVGIQAMQFDGSIESARAIAAWANAVALERGDDVWFDYVTTDGVDVVDPMVHGRDSAYALERGDWVVRAERGDFFACAASVFDATYERAPAPTSRDPEPPYTGPEWPQCWQFQIRGDDKGNVRFDTGELTKLHPKSGLITYSCKCGVAFSRHPGERVEEARAWVEGHLRHLWAREDEVTSTLLELVGISPSKETLATWTDDQVRAAEEWAAAVHLEASDNDVDVPPRPEFLPEPWQGPPTGEGTVMSAGATGTPC